MNDTLPIISTTVHGFVPVRPRFACWGDCHEFDRTHPLKPEAIPAWNDTPHRQLLIGTAQIFRMVSLAALKSP